MTAEGLNLSRLASVGLVRLCLDPPLRSLRMGFSVGLQPHLSTWSPLQAVLQILDIVSQLDTLG